MAADGAGEGAAATDAASREEESAEGARDGVIGEDDAIDAEAAVASPETTEGEGEAGANPPPGKGRTMMVPEEAALTAARLLRDIHFSVVTGLEGVSSMISSMYFLKSDMIPWDFMCLLKS